MTDPVIYANTYWSSKGLYPDLLERLQKLVPSCGEVDNHEQNPALERFRVASNCYYDLYNNGLCNRSQEFKDVFGFGGPYHTEEYESDDWTDDYWWTVENVNRVEATINQILIGAAIEQGLTFDRDQK